MRVQVPVLGTVVGTRTLKDIAAGTPPKPPVDAPAVTVKDMSESAVAALNAAATPRPTAAKTEAVAAAPPAAVSQAPKVAAPTAAAPVDAEDEANKLLQFAENYLRANLKARAIEKYEEIAKKYPKTEAGQTAKAKLAALGA